MISIRQDNTYWHCREPNSNEKKPYPPPSRGYTLSGDCGCGRGEECLMIQWIIEELHLKYSEGHRSSHGQKGW